jgi:D-alanine-D-alanine ligase
MRVAIIYNEPRATEPDEHWLFAAQESTVDVNPAMLEFRDSSEFGVLESMQEIQTALEAGGDEVVIFNVDGNIWRLLDFLRAERPEAIFNLCESVESESSHEAYVAGIYELLHIPYTGAPPSGLTMALNKHRAKDILIGNDIPTPKFVLCETLADINIVKAKLRYPMIIKPSREDASIGIDNKSVVYTEDELRVRTAFIIDRFEQPALVEEFIEGRELNVAVLGNDPPVVLPISEIDFSAMPEGMHRIVTYEAKWMEGSVAYKSTVPKCPAPLEPAVEARVRDIAMRAYRALECRDYCRVDMRITAANEPYVLEVNPNPDLSRDAGFMRSSGTYGLDFDATIRSILACAIARKEKPVVRILQ